MPVLRDQDDSAMFVDRPGHVTTRHAPLHDQAASTSCTASIRKEENTVMDMDKHEM